MDKQHEYEMRKNLEELMEQGIEAGCPIYVFGHCEASLALVMLLKEHGRLVQAILDNNEAKLGLVYEGVPVEKPGALPANAVVFIVSRYYEAMVRQLRQLGFRGTIRKLIDFNTYSNYSLEPDVVEVMQNRIEQGKELLKQVSENYPNHFRVFCPFEALGDIYYMRAYWPAYARKHHIEQVVFCVTSKTLRDVIRLFGDEPVLVYEQNMLDAMVQAALYTRASDILIAHQDRPYVVQLSKALYVKKLTLEQMYCCGVYGLAKETIPVKPLTIRQLNPPAASIDRVDTFDKGVIFAPYAKSVIALEPRIWEEAVAYYKGKGYQCFTNVVQGQEALPGTISISPSISELCSVVEQAGTFVGIRSGLCDVIQEAKAKKIALYPDYYYCDTKWKAMDIYYLEQFDYNLLATEEIAWETL